MSKPECENRKGGFVNQFEHVIKTVYEGSIAQEMEIEPGDVLLSINGEEVSFRESFRS